VEEGLLRRCHNSQKAQEGVGKKFECLFSSLLHFLSVLICDVITFVMFFQNVSQYDIFTVAVKYNHQGRNSCVKQIREGTVAM